MIKPGTGTEHPRTSSQVTVHYSGWQTNGKLFDSSVMRGAPASFGLGDVIAGWTEGVQLMVVGEKTRFWIPENLAYKGQSEPRGMLVFDVELISYRDQLDGRAAAPLRHLRGRSRRRGPSPRSRSRPAPRRARTRCHAPNCNG